MAFVILGLADLALSLGDYSTLGLVADAAALLLLIWGVVDILTPATLLMCPNCRVSTKHYPVRDRRVPSHRVFKCDVCGTRISFPT